MLKIARDEKRLWFFDRTQFCKKRSFIVNRGTLGYTLILIVLVVSYNIFILFFQISQDQEQI